MCTNSPAVRAIIYFVHTHNQTLEKIPLVAPRLLVRAGADVHAPDGELQQQGGTPHAEAAPPRPRARAYTPIIVR